MSDKEYGKVLPQIARMAQMIIFTRLEYERSARPEDLRHALPVEIQDRAILEYTLDAALAKAAEIAGPKDLICIAGSLYLVGEARKKLLGELI
jgi:dihydrofolate synthase/folylpolyglutamate synthase